MIATGALLTLVVVIGLDLNPGKVKQIVQQAPGWLSQVQNSAHPSGDLICGPIANAEAAISRSQLAQVVQYPQNSASKPLQQFLGEAYCKLQGPNPTEASDRDVYPLEFDPETWMVIHYQGDRYLGYDFKFHQDRPRPATQ